MQKYPILRTSILNTWNNLLTAKHAELNFKRIWFILSNSNDYQFANSVCMVLR